MITKAPRLRIMKVRRKTKEKKEKERDKQLTSSLLLPLRLLRASSQDPDPYAERTAKLERIDEGRKQSGKTNVKLRRTVFLLFRKDRRVEDISVILGSSSQDKRN